MEKIGAGKIIGIRLAILFAFFTVQWVTTVQAAPLRDIRGDGKVGLEEAIYALQVAAEMREDSADIGIGGAICALQLAIGMPLQGKDFPASLSLFGSGLVVLAGVGRRKWLRDTALQSIISISHFKH